MEVKEFAKKYQIAIFNSETHFPKYYAVHTIANNSVLDKDYLLCTNLLDKPCLATKIDGYLDTTKYVFFSLGKGYLKVKESIGLIYDPFVLSKITGANLVLNDLLYVLDNSDILETFCKENINIILSLIDSNEDKIITQLNNIQGLKELNLTVDKLKLNFKKNLNDGSSLLIYEPKDKDRLLFTNLFENLLDLLSDKLKAELKDKIKKEIVDKNTIYSNFDDKIKTLFKNEMVFLNQFSDEIIEERMIEIRIPNKHLIKKGLIGIYFEDSD
jgi:hypothetical protein